jgi:hypothetical protein
MSAIEALKMADLGVVKQAEHELITTSIELERLDASLYVSSRASPFEEFAANYWPL